MLGHSGLLAASGTVLVPSKVLLLQRRHSPTADLLTGSTTPSYQPGAGAEYQHSTSRTEANTRATAPASFTFSRLGTRAYANSLTTASVVQRFRKNGANGNQSVTLAPAALGYSADSSNTDSVVANDTFGTSMALNSTGGSGTFTPSLVAMTMGMGDTTDHWMMYRGYAGSSVPASSGKSCIWSPVGYNTDPNTAQLVAAAVPTKWRCAASIEVLACTCAANTLSGDLVLTLWVNGATTAMTGTVAAGSTSRVVFTGGPIALVDGDTISVRATFGSQTGAFTIGEFEMWTKTDRATPEAMQIASHAAGVNDTVTSGFTYYKGLSGSTQPTSTVALTEANFAVPHGFTGRAKKASVYVREASGAGVTSTLYYRVEGVTSSVGVNIPALGSGFYDDTSGATADFGPDDLCCWRFTRSGTGSIVTTSYSVVEEYVSG